MMVPVLMFVCGALVFTEQEIPGVYVNSPNPLTGKPWATSFRQADLDGDGRVDLLFDHEVVLQRDGGFPESARVALPEFDPLPWSDVWNGELYLGSPGRLLVVRWEGGVWKTRLDCKLRWPSWYESLRLGRKGSDARVAFDRFLHDVNGDGTPEIVVSDPNGICIYERTDDGYRQAVCLDVLPKARVYPGWPAPSATRDSGGRAIPLVTESRNYTFWVNGEELTLLEREDVQESRVRFRTTRYQLDPANGYAVMAEKTRKRTSEPLPNYVQACRLNGDDQVDFGGGTQDLAEGTSLMLAVPIMEIVATTDGGKSLYRQRGLMVSGDFTDVDGDGDLDLVIQAPGLFDGGLRECVSRSLTQKTMTHEICVYLQDASGHFSDTPAIQARFGIQLDHLPARLSKMFENYTEGRLVNPTGDFDGDGRRDLLVQSAPAQFSAYINTGNGFIEKPSATVACSDISEFGVTDVDGDGRSDIVVQSSPEGDAERRAVVFFAREGGS